MNTLQMMTNRWIACACAMLVAGGCGSMKVEEFKKASPELVLEEYFTGKTRAWGLFEDRFGQVQRQFVVDIDGVWDGRILTLTENFVYDDGELEERIWTVTKTGQSTYIGTTDNAVGNASGETAGNVFHWEYDFNLNVGEDTWKVHFDDWMFLQPGGVLLNKATVTRWGIRLGTVFLSFERVPE